MDSDWAGCLSTRISTSGGVLSVAVTAMKSWSSTQGSVATCVAEAEYYAALKGAAEALGLRRWQGTSATNSKSSSGVTQQQREEWQPEKG